MSQFKIPLSFTPIDSAGLQKVFESFSDHHYNDIIAAFEAELRSITGAAHVVALNSGTSAIHLALKLLGVGPKDIVIVPTFTYVATVNPVLYENAIPVFIDCEPHGWNMDPELMETAIRQLIAENRRPKAIILVHVYGMPAAIDDIVSVAARYDVPVIEDAAEAIGSKLRDRQVGTFGRIGVLSFNTNKIATTYGGGALLTNDADFMEKARYWSSQSRDDLPYYSHREVGYNYKMSPLNAAHGILQIKRLKSLVDERRLIFQRYKEALCNICDFQLERKAEFSNRWLSTVLLKDDATRSKVEKHLISQGIETRRLWNPMHAQPVFAKYPSFKSNVAEGLFSRGLCLPSTVNKDEMNEVLTAFTKSIK
jgi:dTDP-4-amino-4,6-dideoxygalactose transaminase